jgi:hypothetical protein
MSSRARAASALTQGAVAQGAGQQAAAGARAQPRTPPAQAAPVHATPPPRPAAEDVDPELAALLGFDGGTSGGVSAATATGAAAWQGWLRQFCMRPQQGAVAGAGAPLTHGASLPFQTRSPRPSPPHAPLRSPAAAASAAPPLPYAPPLAGPPAQGTALAGPLAPPQGDDDPAPRSASGSRSVSGGARAAGCGPGSCHGGGSDNGSGNNGGAGGAGASAGSEVAPAALDSHLDGICIDAESLRHLQEILGDEDSE